MFDPQLEDPDPEEDLRERHPELFGLLVRGNTLIDDAGTSWFAPLLVLTGVICVGLHMEWFDGLLGMDLGQYRGWLVYVLVVVAMFALFGVIIEIEERRTYGMIRDQIHQELRRSRISANRLFAMIAGVAELKEISEHLHKDVGLGVSGPEG